MNESDRRKVNVICLKWGTAYPPVYVNRLYAGVKRHLKRPFRFVCFTNEPEGLDEGVEVQSVPPHPKGLPAHRKWPTVYTKLSLFKDGCGGLEGPTLFLDIDQIITGDMDRFFDYKPGEFCIIHNWIERRKMIFRKRPDIGNSSCFRFEAGKMNRVWEAFDADPLHAYDKKLFATEQAFMTHAVGLENVNWWPEDYVASFKRACHRIFPLNLFLPPKPPKGASILCFHGHPNPIQAIEGFTTEKGEKVPVHQRTVPAPWVKELWENG
ncbi:MAG: hypothetical protein K6F50_01205 [Kiritimatiellae bacterium]|nr:hypothetical protein [Kiritimatiellia bacterium]